MPRRRNEGDPKLGKELREARKALGLTQQQMAAKMGSDVKTIRRYERGETSPTTAWLNRWREEIETQIPDTNTLWRPDSEIQFITALKEAAQSTIHFAGVDLRTSLLPKEFWDVKDRAAYTFRDDPEDKQRIYIEWTDSTLPENLLKRLLDEIQTQREHVRAGTIALTTEEADNLNDVYRRLTLERSNPYPRLVALPKPIALDSSRILPVSLGRGKYGISLVAEKNLDLKTAAEFRNHYILHSLPIRVAYLFDDPPGETWVECHQRSCSGNATWPGAWDVGAAGYVDPIRHRDPTARKRISLWQTACDELEKELNLEAYELPHRDNCHFFGTSQDLPTRHINILGYCHTHYKPKPDRAQAPLTLAYDRCRLTPDAVAQFIVDKHHWVPCAILTLILTLEATGYPKQAIEEAFEKIFSQYPNPIELRSERLKTDIVSETGSMPSTT
jgi:transcriptional regulator with XRE-family HTH domain